MDGADGVLARGRGAEGTGGFPGTLGAPGFAASAGAGGLNLVAAGGAGAGLVEEAASGCFQGVAEPLDGAIPGKTDTGLADAIPPDALSVELAPAVGMEGGGRRPGGGGGGTAGLAVGGISSR